MFDLEIIKKIEEEEMKQAVKKLLEVGNLTLIQKDDFIYTFIKGYLIERLLNWKGFILHPFKRVLKYVSKS